MHGSFWNLSRDSNCSSGKSAISSNSGDQNLLSPNETTTTNTTINNSISLLTKNNCNSEFINSENKPNLNNLINTNNKPKLNYSNKVDNIKQALENHYRRNNTNNINNINKNSNINKHFSQQLLTINDDLSSSINKNQNNNSNLNLNNNYYNRYNNYHQQQLISPPVNSNNTFIPYLVTQVKKN